MTSRKSNSWVFTHNNYCNEAIMAWDDFGCMENIRYLIFEPEIGEKGTNHLQGFFQLFKAVDKRELLKQFQILFVNCKQKEIYLDQAGNDDLSRDYCKKEGTWVEWGVYLEPQDCLLKKIEHERTINGFFGLSPKELRRCGGINQAIRLQGQIWSFDPSHFEIKNIQWYWGTSGLGKTKSATSEMQRYCEENGITGGCWRMPIQQKDSTWFDGYFGHPLVLIEEMRPGMIPYATLLQLFDGYDVMVPKKGGFTRWCPKRIWVTSCYSPDQCYPILTQLDSLSQLKRRITHVTHFVAIGDQNE
jgi:hypothetical protein